MSTGVSTTTRSLKVAELPSPHQQPRSTTYVRCPFNISMLEKAALLWSIQKRQIAVLDGSNVELILKDFAILRDSDRLLVASRTVINRVFESTKDSVAANDALKKYLPQFKEQVPLKNLIHFITL